MNSRKTYLFAVACLLAASTRALDAAEEAGDAASFDSDAIMMASENDDTRVDPTVRPNIPEPQHPAPSTPQNVDTNKPFHQWQRATDDWFGTRPYLEDHGISPNAALSLDLAKSLHGGHDTNGWAAGHILDINLTLDTDRLFKWTGGTFFVNFQAQDGSSESVDGAVQLTSQAAIESRTQISELWYEQKLFDGKLRFKGGKMDANNDFSKIQTAGEFLNNSMSMSPTLFGLPSHPDPAPGILAFAYPCEHLYAGAGLYDGSSIRGRRTGTLGVTFEHDSNLFMIGETGFTWTLPGKREGRFAVGVWHMAGSIPALDGGSAAGATGPYAFFEQKLWAPASEEKEPAKGDDKEKKEDADSGDDDRGVGLFLQYGHAGPSYSPVENHIGGGLAWTGPCNFRPDDVLGLGVTTAELGHDTAFRYSRETTVETFYLIRVTKFLSVKPDLQFVHHPAGGGSDCIVATVRMVVDF